MAPQKPKNRVRDDPEVRRAQILDEAIGIIGQRGYYGFTIQELAQRCGLTNGGLLYHFKTKEQLFLAVLQERDRRVFEFVNGARGGAVQESGSRETSLRAMLTWLRVVMVFNSNHPELVRLNTVLNAESLDHAHPANDYVRSREVVVLEQYAKVFAPHFAEPRSKARQLDALMDGLTQQWLRADQGFDLVAEWDQAVAGLLPGVDHPEPLTHL